MKKNDENQNSDSGLTRRIYKKANLDDTVVNIKKDSSDDFNLLSGDEMMDYLEAHDYDYILVMLYPENLTYENFPFYESEGL